MAIVKILIALAILMFLAFKGVPIILTSIISAGIFLLLSGPETIYEGLTTTFMSGAASFVQAYFLTFLFGAVFGTFVEISGAAESIAHAIVGKFGEKFILVGIAVATAVLTMGGVSVYVAFFAIYPFAISLFREANIPRRLFVAAYMAGGGTFTMTGPFSPAVQNVIPTNYLGTDVSAGALVGVICMVAYCAMAFTYLYKRQAAVKAKGETFVPIDSDIEPDKDAKRPNVIISILPMAILLFVLNVLKFKIEISLFCAIISAVVLYFPYYPHDLKFIWKKLGDSAQGAIGITLNTGSTVGFGKIISSSAAFTSLIPAVTSIGGSPLIGAAVATTILCGLSGSASGGLGIAIPIVGELYLPLGVNPEALHRCAALGSAGLDSLPHNGAVVGFLNYSHTTHKEGYFDIFMVSVVFTLIEMVLGIILFSVFGQAYI